MEEAFLVMGDTIAGRKGFAKALVVAMLSVVLCIAGAIGSPDVADAAGLTTGALKAQAVITQKCYTIETSNTPVYSNANLTSRIGAVYGSDEVRINSFSSNRAAANVTYPTSRGSKSGWIRTSAILSATGGNAYASKGRFTTYRRPGGASYGAVYKGDQVVVLGRKGNWTQIRYPISGGYKFAWASTSTVMANTTGKLDNVTAAVQQRLDKIANGSLRYNKYTVMKLGSKFTGTRANEQCKGFAKNVFYLCFKVTPNSTQPKPNNYLLYGTNGMSRVGYYSNITTAHAKSLFSKARPGDFVQMRRRSTGGSHSAIVYSVSSSGITFFEANTDGKNTVMKNTYTWAQLANRNRGMSLYTASSYSLK